MQGIIRLFAAALLAMSMAGAVQAQSPEVTEGDITAPRHVFADGKALTDIRLHYRTLGTPRRNERGEITNAVMLLHGTGGNGGQFLAPFYVNALFAPGAPLDAQGHYIILPDAVGHGQSAKPSDGLGPDFPQYDYADMVALQHHLLTEGLGVDRLKLLMGMSMGGMHAFEWAVTHPDFAEAIMPFACLPVELAGRNRIWRKMAIDSIKRDPGFNGGDYSAQPRLGLMGALDLLLIHTSNPIAMQADFPTRALADERAAARYAGLDGLDGNDMIYALDASRNYNPAPKLDEITAAMTLVNSADDFSNPPELGIAEREMARIPEGRFHLIPASEKTRGHASFTQPEYWLGELEALLERAGP